jgi:hypothetical protein
VGQGQEGCEETRSEEDRAEEARGESREAEAGGVKFFHNVATRAVPTLPLQGIVA